MPGDFDGFGDLFGDFFGQPAERADRWPNGFFRRRRVRRPVVVAPPST